MPRGRPAGSSIRQNIVELLFYLPKGYGYQISKLYNRLFPQVSQRSIYYHLRKGVLTQELIIHAIEQEQGDFSWGKTAEKIYYTLGSTAAPRGNERVKKFLEDHLPRERKEGSSSFIK